MRFLGGGMAPALVGLVTACVAALVAQQTHGEVIAYQNSHPEIQMWSYPAGSANGPGAVRDRGPTFAAFSGFDPDTQQAVFFPGTGLGPSRRGSILIAADTSADVPTGLDHHRYQIDSLRISATVLGSLVFPPSFVLPYDNTIDDALSLTTAGGDDAGHPIELYGLGLQGDYETIDFGAAANPHAFQLGDVRWRQYREGEDGYNPELPASEQPTAPYQYFAVDASGRDVENSVVGGYSATDPTNSTQQFTPEPFAIGKLYDEQGVELAPGTNFQNGDVFIFEPNLQDERIVDYLQRSLSAGHLGFSLSSMHQPAGHTGSVPYPDFYLDDLDVGPNVDGAAPTMELTVTLLDESLPGDYDGNGYVDAQDYAMWKSQFGGAGPEADGDNSGGVGAVDYAVWRDNLGAGTPPMDAFKLAAAGTIPEPSSVQMAVILLVTALFCGSVDWLNRPRRSPLKRSQER